MSVFIICEAGVNHDGSLDRAKRLVDAAKGAGADAVKFQFFSSRKLWGDDRIAHLELRFDDFGILKRYCDAQGIEFMCTPFGVEEVLMLKPLLKRYKVASGCLTREPILRAIGTMRMPVIVSTGMALLEEIGQAIKPLPRDMLTLLHCTSAYPCPVEDANLRAIDTMRNAFRMPIGYSDHTQGITVPIAATALGATVIEKHLTLDRDARGPDHKASIEPGEFRVMVGAIRTVEKALGDGDKCPAPIERALRKAWREPFSSPRAS